MAQYVISMFHPDEPVPEPAELNRIMTELGELREEMTRAGAWVFSAGLAPSTTATVLRVDGDEVLVTDGPFVEGKEHLGGFTVIEAPDLDAALHWGRAQARITGLPTEVRPARSVPTA